MHRLSFNNSLFSLSIFGLLLPLEDSLTCYNFKNFENVKTFFVLCQPIYQLNNVYFEMKFNESVSEMPAGTRLTTLKGWSTSGKPESEFVAQ
jgi:hypothetical protein